VDKGLGLRKCLGGFELSAGMPRGNIVANKQRGRPFMPIRSAVAFWLGLITSAGAVAQEPPMGPLRPDQAAFRALYQELVETNTTLSAGSCTTAAERIAVHLKSAGFQDKDITLFSVPEHPKEGGVVAVLTGTSKSAKPMLLLGHLDVVEAKRLNERRSVRSVYVGRDFLTDLIKLYAEAG
jgi:hypothetical protein